MDVKLRYIENLSLAVKNLDSKLLDQLENEIVKRIDSNKSIYIIGNGGSAANAHHIAGDYLKSLSILGHRLNISCPSDNICSITALANDVDYSQVYEIFVKSVCLEGDLLITLSGSGNSTNLVKAALAAKIKGMTVCTLTGYTGGSLKKIGQVNLHFDVMDMEIAEDCQLIIFHILKQVIVDKHKDQENKVFSDRYEKRVIEDLTA